MSCITAGSVEIIRQAKKNGVNVTCEATHTISLYVMPILITKIQIIK